MNPFAWIGEIAACVSDPFGCTMLWLDTLPALSLILVSLVAGALLGAALGWKGLAIVGTLGGVVFFAGRQSAEPHENVSGKDAAPSVRKVPKVRTKPKYLLDRILEGLGKK